MKEEGVGGCWRPRLDGRYERNLTDSTEYHSHNQYQSYSYDTANLLDYRYSHHPMAYFNQGESFGLNMMSYQSPLHSARSVFHQVHSGRAGLTLDQLLSSRTGLWGETMGTGGHYGK